MTIALCDPSGYEKTVNLLQHGLNMFHPPWLQDITPREIQVCGTLRRYPHPNICHYRGVSVEKGIVSGLIFDRYDMTLRDMLYQGQDINIPKCLQDIEDGIMHIHALGLIHCDIKPENIFVHLASQRFVIGDFDSVHHEWEGLELKSGTPGWMPEDDDTDDIAKREMDWYSWEMLRAWLYNKCHTVGGKEVSTPDILAKARKDVSGGVEIPVTLLSSQIQDCGENAMDTAW